jgi:tRNA (cytidine/uridine-2'-O-)-methyltransferase
MSKFLINIALYRPEIPQNTGNIARTCVGLNVPLHIIGRPAFSLEDKQVRRAGLDYWKDLNLIRHENWKAFLEANPGCRFHLFTKSGKKSLFDVQFQQNDFLIFGRETEGLPRWILDEHAEGTVYLPMPGNVRSYNLSNTVAVAVFEAYRQLLG